MCAGNTIKKRPAAWMASGRFVLRILFVQALRFFSAC
jgi:hypothetical protein